MNIRLGNLVERNKLYSLIIEFLTHKPDNQDLIPSIAFIGFILYHIEPYFSPLNYISIG